MNCSEKSNKINWILLALYLSFVFISQVMVSENYLPYYRRVGCVFCVVLAAILAPVILSFFSKLSFPDDSLSKAHKKPVRLAFYAIPFLVLLVYLFAYYPGSYSYDSYSELQQALTNEYNDWHPALHTLLAFKIPLVLSGYRIGCIILFQIINCSIIFGYCFQTIYETAGKKYLIGSMIFILCNPLTCNFIMFPLKDVTFNMWVLLLIVFSLQIYVSKGIWIERPWHLLAFAAVFAMTTVIRHNAILFTAPLLIAVFFQIPRKRFLLTVAIVIGLIVTIKGPLYSLMHVTAPGARQTEMLGLPMTIIGAAVSEVPELLDDEVLEFAAKIAPLEVWKETYRPGAFNWVKFQSPTVFPSIEEYGAAKVIPMALNCFKIAPSVCMRALIKLTESIYTLTDPHFIWMQPAETSIPEVIGTTRYTSMSFPASTQTLREILNSYGEVAEVFLRPVFMYYGFAHLLFIIAILSKSRLDYWQDWKRIMLILPVFVYNYGTSLLLSGYNDCPRFFHYSVMILPIIMLFFYRKEQNPDNSTDTANLFPLVYR